MIPLCSDRLFWSKSVALLYHWTVPPCYVYSIAHFLSKCNTQNKQSSQNIFVQEMEIWQILIFLLQLTWECDIIEDVVVYPPAGDGTTFLILDGFCQTTHDHPVGGANIRRFIH